MRRVTDEKKLDELTIPGTHDTCTASYKGIEAPGVRTQDSSVREQLNNGIRFIDIRCRNVEDGFAIVHGSYYLHKYFGKDVLNVCVKFLEEHPSETIVMSVKEEGKPKKAKLSFEGRFEKYVEGSKTRWYFGDEVPRLGDVRGKIVLFRRFKAKRVKGLDASAWKNDATFEIKGTRAPMKIQDVYQPSSLDDKYAKVKRLLDEAASGGTPGTLYVDFCSAAPTKKRPILPFAYAAYINPLVSFYVASAVRHRLGIVVMDFPLTALTRLLVGTNLSARAAVLAGMGRAA
jgi:1-phosphatidylinositol phosphodiesterase